MIALMVLAALAGTPPVVGAWALPGAADAFAVFHADGTCTLDGAACTWRTSGDGRTLFITPPEGETEAVPFAVQGGALSLTVGGVAVALARPAAMAAPAVAAPAAPAAPAATAATKVDGNDPLAKLLLSSPWCTFHYSQVSGSSSSTRVAYFADGTYRIGGRYEGYSSGSAGTFSSQHDSGSTGRWTVQKGVLMATPPPTADNPMPTQMVAVPLTVTRNSNGYPIINALGNEYSQCR